ncbi:eukaryotic aspartyl protease [Ancylostoma ceylanicum]|uniref:Eukaryotic aspartyl protease n=1 Tax=Ancylostoma ceylanicum TaxID=53326 RepID=A0A0D6M2B7_9BILA|nr:eukaryotic aspartyl protease [Ancylostoma ceylanicum]
MAMTKILPQRIKMIRDGTWAKHMEEMREQRLRLPQLTNAIYVHDIVSYGDVEYLGEITIGTPAQTFRVRAICEIFCEDKSCCRRTEDPKAKNPCHGKRRFDMGRSSTYVKTDGKWEIDYMGSSVEGFFGNDTIRFGAEETEQLIVPGTVFGQAKRIAPLFGPTHIEGILGLAFKSLAIDGFTPPLIRAIDLKLFDQPIFTAYFKRVGEQVGVHGGHITYGGIDRDHCEEAITYERLTSASYWQFRLKAVQSKKYSSNIGWEAMSDTGSSFIAAPAPIIEKIAKEYGAQYDSNNDIYYLLCDTKIAVNLTIGEKIYTLTAKNILSHVFATPGRDPVNSTFSIKQTKAGPALSVKKLVLNMAIGWQKGIYCLRHEGVWSEGTDTEPISLKNVQHKINGLKDQINRVCTKDDDGLRRWRLHTQNTHPLSMAPKLLSSSMDDEERILLDPSLSIDREYCLRHEGVWSEGTDTEPISLKNVQHKINGLKDQINRVCTKDDDGLRRWRLHTQNTHPLSMAPKLLRDQYNCPGTSQAYCKFLEILRRYRLVNPRLGQLQ